MKFSLLKDREGETQRDKQTERGGGEIHFLFIQAPFKQILLYEFETEIFIESWN